jgi:predicted protein tyrosine phosphatase
MSDPIARAVPLEGTYWVIPQQFLAGEYPGEPARNQTAKRLRRLIAAGIRTFIDLTDEDEINEDARRIPAYRSILREVSDIDVEPITYVNIPVVDRDVPSPWTMRCILDVIDRSLADENPVFVHCWAGRGRTGTVVGCYLKRHGMADDSDVIQKIASLRHGLPTAKETSPHTKEQLRMVKNWRQGV